MGKAFDSIKQGLTEAVGHAKGTQAGVKMWRPAPMDVATGRAAWASPRRNSQRASACGLRPCGNGSVATATLNARRWCCLP